MFARPAQSVMRRTVQRAYIIRAILTRYTVKRLSPYAYVRYEKSPWCPTPPFPFPTYHPEKGTSSLPDFTLQLDPNSQFVYEPRPRWLLPQPPEVHGARKARTVRPPPTAPAMP